MTISCWEKPPKKCISSFAWHQIMLKRHFYAKICKVCILLWNCMQSVYFHRINIMVYRVLIINHFNNYAYCARVKKNWSHFHENKLIMIYKYTIYIYILHNIYIDLYMIKWKTYQFENVHICIVYFDILSKTETFVH